MHSSAPLSEELENVPRGHGNKVVRYGSLLGIDLKPDAKRAEIRAAL